MSIPMPDMPVSLVLTLVGILVTAVGLLSGIFWRVQVLINRIDDKQSSAVASLHTAVITTQKEFTAALAELQKAFNTDIIELHRKYDAAIMNFIRREEMQTNMNRLETGITRLTERFDQLTSTLIKRPLGSD